MVGQSDVEPMMIPTSGGSEGFVGFDVSGIVRAFRVREIEKPRPRLAAVADRIVPKVGLEPTHPCGHRILNPTRLPFRHFGNFAN